MLEARLDGTDGRLDRALASALPTLSRARLQALIAGGAVTCDDAPVRQGSAAARAGLYRVAVPPPEPAEPEPEALPLAVLHEDAHLIVVDKPAGMPVHPSHGHARGTLVNALLHHCAGRLSGIGGVARPGIVHRLDKDTSGVMVAAKSDAAHAGLSALFAQHDITRSYIALTRGAPDPRAGRIETRLGRSTSDRKKMAVLRSGGREAVTDYATLRTFGPDARPLAAEVRCILHTGRTHQIRVHLAHRGAPLLGDPVYGSGGVSPTLREAVAAAGLSGQALHAAILGFVHPITGEALRFESPPPRAMQALAAVLAAL
ncbi:MAG: RluA family pseudouridine synthase [Brevundimonas sp.]|uniref:RluA family pseudouridine synthase n=1 Tax=Brevundimonas sp. TaxID=1871086 RepID=UPI00391AB332